MAMTTELLRSKLRAAFDAGWEQGAHETDSHEHGCKPQQSAEVAFDEFMADQAASEPVVWPQDGTEMFYVFDQYSGDQEFWTASQERALAFAENLQRKYKGGAFYRVDSRRLGFPWSGEDADCVPAASQPRFVSTYSAAQCCMCGRKNLSTVEGDGGSECQLPDGRWTCSRECWGKASEGMVDEMAEYVTSFEMIAGPENDPVRCGLLTHDHPWQLQPMYNAVVGLRWQGDIPAAIVALIQNYKSKLGHL